MVETLTVVLEERGFTIEYELAQDGSITGEAFLDSEDGHIVYGKKFDGNIIRTVEYVSEFSSDVIEVARELVNKYWDAAVLLLKIGREIIPNKNKNIEHDRLENITCVKAVKK